MITFVPFFSKIKLALGFKNFCINIYLVYFFFPTSKQALVQKMFTSQILEKEHDENQSDWANAFKVVLIENVLSAWTNYHVK